MICYTLLPVVSFIKIDFISSSFFNLRDQALRRAGVIRQCKWIALGGAGENREWPTFHDLADFSGGRPRRAVSAGSGH